MDSPTESNMWGRNLWITVLSATGVLALGAQAYGLKGVIASQASRELWEAKQGERAALEQQWAAGTAQIDSAMRDAQTRRAAATGEALGAEQSLAEISDRLLKSKEELRVTQADRAAALREREIAFAEHARLQALSEALCSEESQHLARVNEARAAREQEERRLREAEAAAAERRARLTQLERSIAAAEQRQAAVQAEAERLGIDWRTADERLRRADAARQAADAARSRAIDSRDAIAAEVSQLQTSKARISAEVDSLRAATVRVRQEFEAARVAAEGNVTRVREQEDRLAQARGSLAAVDEQLQQRQAALTSKQAQLDGLIREMEPKQREAAALAQRLSREREDEAALLRRLEELRRILPPQAPPPGQTSPGTSGQ